MKCWPDGATAAVKAFDYPDVGAPAAISWEAFGCGPMAGGEAPVEEDRSPAAPNPNPAETTEAHAEELRRSFESGRECGWKEGRAMEREACAALLQASESRHIEKAARLLEGFDIQRIRYFETVEREVVRLALAVAARILRREAQMDPLLLSGAVRVALGQLASSTPARLRVPPSDVELWKDTIANLPNLPVKPAVLAGDAMSLGECVLETELGSVDLSVAAQLAEIEHGFFDRVGSDREGGKAMAIGEDMSE